MKQTLISTTFKLIAITLLMLPVLLIIQVSTGDDIRPFSHFYAFLTPIISFGVRYIDWVGVTIVSYMLLSKVPSIVINVKEEIRERHFRIELQRWGNTPYCPPILYYYLMTPPTSFSPYLHDHVHNHFYKRVVHAFRDSVYIFGEAGQEIPNKESSLWKNAGFSHLFSIIFSFGLVVGFVTYTQLTFGYLAFVLEWQRFTLPLLLYFLFYSVYKGVVVFMHANPNRYRKLMVNYFEEPEPRITWLSLYPDQPRGKAIIQCWEAQRERKARQIYQAKGWNVPQQMNYNHASIAPFPYPSEHIPEWREDYDHHLQQKQQENDYTHLKKRVANGSNRKVVAFPKKKR